MSVCYPKRSSRSCTNFLNKRCLLIWKSHSNHWSTTKSYRIIKHAIESSFHFSSIYDEPVCIKENNVEQLLYAAEKYDLDMLKNKCVAFLLDNYENSGFALSALELAQRYGLGELLGKCMEFISGNARTYLESEGFLNVSSDLVALVVGSDNVCIDEIDLYNAVVNWAEQECVRQKLCVCGSHVREILGPMLYCIRFPLINGEIFCEQIKTRNILNQNEIVEILEYYVTQNQSECGMFSSKLRRSFTGVGRNTIDVNGEWLMNSNKDAISFTLWQPAIINGIAMYGSKTQASRYTYTATLLEGEKTHRSITGAVDTTPSDRMYELKFKSPLYLEASVQYSVTLEAKGPPAWRGDRGQSSVTFGNNVITFTQCSLATNGTTVENGQIPALLLSNY